MAVIAAIAMAGALAGGLWLLHVAVRRPEALSDKAESCAGTLGVRSEFWRELSWRCGDEHANRICRWVDLYCRLFRLERKRFYRRVPRAYT